jgi:hypothetical protein
MRQRRRWQWIVAWIALCLPAVPAAAITIQLDYTYDTAGFFATGSPAQTTLQAAADYFSDILDDTFSAITVPAPYHSSVPGSTGTVTWSWQRGFTNPSTGAFTTIDNGNIAADQYIIYAGTRAMSGNTAGVGGPGSQGWEKAITGTNSFTQSDIDNIDAIHESFVDSVETRGESSGFARWGGAISFDTSNRNWHFGLTSPSGNVTDFYSIAVHELAHALGFGELSSQVQTDWESWISGSSFLGSNANAEYGGAVPLSTDLAHWANDTSSVIYGTSTPQEAVMDPDLLQGTRKRLTALDAAALKDIGWTVIPPPGLNGDYNENGVVDAADYAIWRKTIGTSAAYNTWRTNFGQSSFGSGAGSASTIVPEPAGAVLVVVGCVAFGFARRKRRG